MQAYKKGITKEQFVNETKSHQLADNFLRGTYNEGEKGCAVGCALKSVAKLKGIKIAFDRHQEFETHLGIPEWLARVEDTIFEGVSLERSKKWPVEFAESINEGADLEKAKAPFMLYILEQNIKYLDSCEFDKDTNPDVVYAIEGSKKAINTVIELYKSEKWDDEAARSAAESAAWSAESAAESAAWSAWSAAWSAAESAARSAAWSAARSAARSAESAARSAESAAESAAWSAWSAWSAAWSAAESAARSAAWSAARSAAWSAARSAAFEKYADKLLEILKEIK